MSYYGKRLSFFVLVSSIVLLIGITPAWAFHTVFDYEIESFQVIGNLPDGLIEEFDDGSQDWFAPIGTVTESDGALHLKSPGAHYPFLTSNALVVDRSDAIADSGFAVVNGLDDFIGITTLRKIIPEKPGGYFAVNLVYDVDASTREFMTLSYVNLSNPVANAVNNEFDAGFSGSGLNLAMTSWRYANDGSSFEILNHQVVNIATTDVTDNIIFQLEFNDSTNMITGTISVDGGSMDATSFNPVSWNPPNVAVWTLFGDPMTLAPPQPVPSGPAWITALVLLLSGTLYLAYLNNPKRRATAR